MSEFKPWSGHVPRDRASIWYLVPLMINVIGVLIVLAAVVAVVLAVT